MELKEIIIICALVFVVVNACVKFRSRRIIERGRANFKPNYQVHLKRATKTH